MSSGERGKREGGNGRELGRRIWAEKRQERGGVSRGEKGRRGKEGKGWGVAV